MASMMTAQYLRDLLKEQGMTRRTTRATQQRDVTPKGTTTRTTATITIMTLASTTTRKGHQAGGGRVRRRRPNHLREDNRNPMKEVSVATTNVKDAASVSFLHHPPPAPHHHLLLHLRVSIVPHHLLYRIPCHVPHLLLPPPPLHPTSIFIIITRIRRKKKTSDNSNTIEIQERDFVRIPFPVLLLPAQEK